MAGLLLQAAHGESSRVERMVDVFGFQSRRIVFNMQDIERRAEAKSLESVNAVGAIDTVQQDRVDDATQRVGHVHFGHRKRQDSKGAARRRDSGVDGKLIGSFAETARTKVHS